MSDDPLATYLHDHLAGARSALDVLHDLRDEHSGEPLGDFCAELMAEIEEDRAELENLASRVGGGVSRTKEAMARLGTRLSRPKLGRNLAGDFGIFQALEVIALGIQGKLALWRALSIAAETDARLRGLDFERLSNRAKEQHARVEERRLLRARAVFQPAHQRS